MISELSEILLTLKEERNLTFAELAEEIGRSEVWTAALFYGQAQASKEEAIKILEKLDLDDSYIQDLCRLPVKGIGPTVPTDPLVYRLYEIVQVYGYPVKDIIQEKFGDGIMSAVDFTLSVDKEEAAEGDRVVVTMSGKFLPYKKW